MVYLDRLIEQAIKLAIIHRKKLYLLGFIVLSYVLVMLIVMVLGKTVNKPDEQPKSYNQLDTYNYVKSFRKSDRDFDVTNIYFTSRTLVITVKLLYKPQTELELKTLSRDIVLGLSTEYPDLERIKVKLQRRTPEGELRKLGYCEFTKQTNLINWVSE